MIDVEGLHLQEMLNYACTQGFHAGFIQCYELISEQLQNMANNPNIITIKHDGFNVNLNNMIVNKPYIIKYYESTYVAFKNKSLELVITEMS